MKWLDNIVSRTSIRSQLVLTVAAGILVLLSSLIVASTWITNQQLRQLLINQGLQTTANLAESSVLALLFHSPENVDAAVNAALALQGVSAVTIYTAEGESLLHVGKPASPEKLNIAFNPDDTSPRIYSEDDAFWYYLATVIITSNTDDMDSVLYKKQTQNQNKHLGYVYVTGSKTTLDKIGNGILLSNFTITLVIGLMLLLAIQFSIRRLIQPLDRITTVMKKAEEGEYEPQVDVQGPHEIHHIAGAYNRMIKALTERDRKLRKQNIQLEKQAIHDYLTRLVNRAGFDRALKQAIEESKTLGTKHALCYMDLDRFKAVNDACGHNAGDILLKNVCNIFKRHIRKDSDVLARIGGDEFALLLRNCPISKAEAIGNSICRDVDHYRFSWSDQQFSVGVSIGIVSLDEYISSCDDILMAADTACYLAKESGRGKVHVLQPGETNIFSPKDSSNIVQRIEECLEHKRFELFCQPVSLLGRAEQAGESMCEILLRIPGGDTEYLLPGTFMPVAERNRMGTMIDRWVVSQTLACLNQHALTAKSYDVCSINITTHSLLDESFIEYFESVLSEYAIEPARICFEISESDFINNSDALQRFYTQMQYLGTRVAIDDFTGNTAVILNLQNMKIDYLKIDHSIIHDLKSDSVKTHLIKFITEVSGLLGIKTVAKHVDNTDLMNDLVALGIDYAQGWALQKPAPFEAGNRIESDQISIG